MARTEKEIEQLYENLRKTAGTDKSLNRFNSTVFFMLKTMYAASAVPPRVNGFGAYCDALTDLYTMDASRANNKEKIIKALTTLDGFEDFLKQMPEGSEKTNYQLLVEKGGRMGAGKDKFDRMVAQLNDAVGLAIDLPVLQTEAPVRKEAEPEKAPGNGRKNGSAAQPEAQPKSRSAARWIEDWKRQAAAESKKEDYPAAYYAKIMAARMLANSKRGKAKRLKDTRLTEEQIEAKAKELRENGLFGRFIQSLRDNGQKRAKAEAAVGAGHCGGLDDMFKEFLLKLPAGELKNEKLLNRYMPTAKDRIEELQQQVELKQKKISTPVRRRLRRSRSSATWPMRNGIRKAAWRRRSPRKRKVPWTYRPGPWPTATSSPMPWERSGIGKCGILCGRVTAAPWWTSCGFATRLPLRQARK